LRPLLLFSGLSTVGYADGPPTGNAVIRAQAGPSEIVITTTARLAGAIHSVTRDGKEFIDSLDHGRQLQSAANFDCAGRFIPEVFNPTEAERTGISYSRRLLRSTAILPQSKACTGLRPASRAS
jgi:hypothetical protein